MFVNGNGPAGNSATDGGDSNNSDTEAVDGSENTETDNGTDETKSTETVEFWKQQARKNEDRAKANAKAAEELAQIRESQKTQAEKDAEALKAAETAVASVPAQIAEGIKAVLVDYFQIDDEDAEFLTATDPEALRKQFDRLLALSGKGERKKHIVPNQGKRKPSADKDSNMREFARNLFGNNT